MTSTHVVVLLRALALTGVVAAIVNPGCTKTRRPTVELLTTDDVAATSGDRIGARLATATRSWADLRVKTPASPPAATADLRVIAGHSASTLTMLQRLPAALAVRVEDRVLEIARMHAPARVTHGGRTDVVVALTGIPSGPGTLTLTLVDRSTGVEVAQETVDTKDIVDGRWQGLVPWLPTREGDRVLRLTAGHTAGGAVRESRPVDVVVQVLPLRLHVEVLEARPTWSARFARLALAGQAGITLSTEVRVAPGIAVRTQPGAKESAEAATDASVILVGGVDALTDRDVSRLEREVRERGRALVLLLDEAPAPGAWTRLWPESLGRVRSSGQPLRALVAGHPWLVREWLSPATPAAGVALASLESARDPVVVGRGLGAGRVIGVTALDAWRWRADERAEFARGWQALLRGLAASVPGPVALTAWLDGDRLRPTVHAEVTVRPDVRAQGAVDMRAEVEWSGRATHPLVLVAHGDGRFRGAVRPWDGTTALVRVQAVRRGELVAGTQAVVHVSAIAPTASWTTVERHQRERGRAATAEATMEAALETLRQSVVPHHERWFVTRTWWYAGIVAGLLGTEWILRRRGRRR